MIAYVKYCFVYVVTTCSPTFYLFFLSTLLLFARLRFVFFFVYVATVCSPTFYFCFCLRCYCLFAYVFCILVYVACQVKRRAGNFWDNVTNTYTIDLTRFELPGCKRVKFSMIDPVYVWIQQCHELWAKGIALHFQPKTLHHPETDEELYGGGIQYSKLMRAAYASLGKPGRVTLFNLDWDGGSAGFGSRSCTPVHVQVMNTNSSSTSAVGLVGYIPYIDVPEGYRQENNFINARHHVLQVCVRDLEYARLRSSFNSCSRLRCRHVLDTYWTRSKHGRLAGSNVMSKECQCCFTHALV